MNDRSQISIHSANRNGLSVSDLRGALSQLYYAYNPGNEPQKAALELAIDSLRDWQEAN